MVNPSELIVDNTELHIHHTQLHSKNELCIDKHFFLFLPQDLHSLVSKSEKLWVHRSLSVAKMNTTRHRLIRELNRLASTSATSAAPSAPQTTSAQSATATATTNSKTQQSRKIASSSYATSTCPHMMDVDSVAVNTRLHPAPAHIQQQAPPTIKLENARPYSEVPGPKPLPILGNTWR